MMTALGEARSKVGKMIESATPKHKSDMGVLFNVIKNVHLGEFLAEILRVPEIFDV
jgi:hypothetical protein